VLCITPSTGVFGGLGAGPIAARALQTVDRSSTAGLVMARVLSVDEIVNSHDLSASLTGPSPAIWSSCPIELIRNNPRLGVLIDDNFALFPPHSSTAAGAVNENLGGYEAYLHQGGSITPAALGEGLTFASDGDNEGAGIGPGMAPFQIDTTNGYKLWFEALIELSTITDTKNGVFCGLIAANALAAAVPIADAGTLADTNFIGFHRLEGDGDAIDTVYKADGETQQTVKADAITIAAATAVKVGILFDGSAITFYANGVALDDGVAAAGIDAATFPDDVGLGLVFALKNATGTSPGSAKLKWWRAAQLFV
jgi:hypothetical protein